jgi:putative DNA primase/helicase
MKNSMSDAARPARPNTIASQAAAFKKLAEPLADFTLARIAVRKDVFGITLADGRRITGHEALTRELLIRHYRGLENIGAHLISPDNRCLCLVGDVDAHDASADADVNWQCVLAIVDAFKAYDLAPLVCDSNGAGGFHVREFFKKPLGAGVACWLAQKIKLRLKAAGLPDVEVFPKQGEVNIDTPYGNWVRLPGKHPKRDHWTRVWDQAAGKWLEGEAATRAILAVAGDDTTKLLAAFKAAQPATDAKADKKRQKPADDRQPDEDEVRSALFHCPNSNVDYDAWIGRGFALHDWDSARGLALWVAWSEQSPKHVGGECERRWISMGRGGGITAKSLFKLAYSNGWTWKPNPAAVVNAKPSPNGSGQQKSPLLNRTDLGNAERLVAANGDKIRWVERFGTWLVWDGQRWAEDTTGRVFRMARHTIRGIGAEAQHAADNDEAKAILRWALASESRPRIEATIAIARYLDGVSIEPDTLDADPWLFNVANGTIDLRTGKLRPHDPANLITKLSPVAYDPNASCPRWEQFEKEVFADDDSLIKYMRRVIGYALTGTVRQHGLYFLHGSGRNGKSKYIETISYVLGDYATIVNAEVLTSKNQESHPTALTELKGRRFVSTIEIEDGKKMAEALVKSLTGGDEISARRMRQDFYKFKPTHKLFLAANHKPEIRGTDVAIWSRVKLIPFDVTFTEDANEIRPPDVLQMDAELGDKLAAEAPGILRLMLFACLKWQRNGLQEPDKVQKAVTRYKAEMDAIGDFIREQCVVAKPHMKDLVIVKSSSLYAAYEKWTKAAGVDGLTKRDFGKEMEQRGFTWKDNNSVRWRIGIALK